MTRLATSALLLTLFVCGTVVAQARQGPGKLATRLTTLHGFTGGTDGSAPAVHLVADSAGALYGTTSNGGILGFGSVFQLMPPSQPGGAWTYSQLYSFAGGSDGEFPQSSLMVDSAGNLYGTTYQGGSANLGTVFELSPPAVGGGSWTETVLYSFAGGSDGAYPFGGVVSDAQGNLYGTTQQGGIYRCTQRKIPCGTIFRLSLSPAGAWTEAVLYYFSGRADGGLPDAGLTIDAAGNLYGTTQFGGSTNPRFGGSIFQFMPPAGPGGTWTFNALYDFYSTGQPSYYGDLLLDNGGAIYGTSWSGGAAGWGFVYKLNPPAQSGGTWTMTTLWSFSGTSDGSIPFGGVTLSGNALYGTTYSGGNLARCNGIGCGVLFKLTPKAGGAWKQSVLYKFQGGTDGATPQGGLLYNAGTLFGTTSAGFAGPPGGGTVFSYK